MKYINPKPVVELGAWTRNAVGTVVDVGSLVGIGDFLRDLAELATLVARGEFPFDDSSTTVGLGAASTLTMIDTGTDSEDGTSERGA